jgi:competence ComEA-like helix-hairpin-helix protein
MHQRASILVGLLWCLALLSVVVVSVLHTSRMDLMVQKNYNDRIQARYLALAGVEKAKALLFQDAVDRRKTGKNHTGELYDDEQNFRQIDFGPGEFSVVRHRSSEEGDGLAYGVVDQESRLNVNNAGAEELVKLNGSSPDVAAAIVDWRDEDNNVSPGGAEEEYYLSLNPPYLPRNGQFLSTTELLMVRGISSDLLKGGLQNGSEFPELDDDPGNKSAVATQPINDRGWSELLCTDGWVENFDASGEKRVNVQTATEKDLTGVHGITAEIAKAIVSSRGQNQLESISDLLNVTSGQNQSPTRTSRQGAASQGSKVINQDLLMEIADHLCTDATDELAGLININTAGSEVLACLPGLTPELANAIVTYRRAEGFFDNVARVMKVPGISADLFKQFSKRLTARSETFRIICEGKVKSTGARQRLEVVVHVGQKSVETLSYREDL